MGRKKKQSMMLEPLPEERIDDDRFSILAPTLSNIVMYADYDIDDATLQLYNCASETALQTVETMMIVGMCRTMRRLQLSVFGETGEMLPVPVINYHLHKHKGKIEARRKEFLEKQKEATWEILHELSAEPNSMVYQRMANSAAIALERVISCMAESEIMADTLEIRDTLSSIKSLMDIDPLYMRGKLKREFQTMTKKTKATAAIKAEAYFEQLANFNKEANKDADYDELAEFTKGIVDRAGGGLDDALESPDGPEDSGAWEEAV
ncbi:MAG: hypothetical protein ABIK92_21840 [Pseudomonadota bacterium]|uniref:Uncharacterized protein n=1 Tax=viral metagenome TaxID=1070528 RepID=A0A6M3L3X8_9ZZZZ